MENQKVEKNKRVRHYPQIMQKDDLECVARIEKECFVDPWSANSLELLTHDGIGVGMVCKENDKIVAYGGMLCVVDEGQITRIATHPDYRNKGYGRAVVLALKKHAKEVGIDSISLEVRESNMAAKKLYSDLDFKIEGKRNDFYTKPKEDAFVMVCKIK